MSFWESELGAITGSAEDAFTKSYRLIPDGTMALARIESFKQAESFGTNTLNIEWLLTDGDFKGQKVTQKLKVFGDAKQKHRALNMLKLVYQLFNLKPAHNNTPSDQELMVFVGKSAGIMVRETPPNDNGKQYNWVSEVHDSKGFVCVTGIGLPVTPKMTSELSAEDAINRAFDSVHDDDVPF